MSFGVNPDLELGAVTDPQMYFHSTRSIPVLKGPQIVTAQTFPAPAPISTSGLNIQCSPPSRDILISRRVLLQIQFQMVVNGTNVPGGSQPLELGIADGPRAMPIQSILNSMTWQIGNDTITSGGPMYQYVPALLRYHNSKDSQDRNYSLSPSMLDTMANYNNPTIYSNVNQDPANIQLGNNFNPLADYGENPAQVSRGAFPFDAIADDQADDTTATVTFTCTEPIFISPFVFSEDDGMANCLTGIQALNFQCTFNNALYRIWSHSNFTANTPCVGDGGNGKMDIPDVIGNPGYQVSILNANLQFTYLTPPASLYVPKVLSWAYYNPVIYATTTGTTLGAFNSGTDRTVITQNTITLDGIPRRLYIFARKNDIQGAPIGPATETTAWLNATSADTFFHISNLQLQFNNGTYMSSFSAQQLYEMSRRNGCNLSWASWRNFVGSVICVNVGVDLGLSGPYDTPGLSGQFNLSVTASVQNLSANVCPNVQMFVLAVYEGQLQVKNNAVSHSTNLLSREDVMRARELPHVIYDPSNEVWGGNIFKSLLSGLKSAFNRARDFGRVALPIADKIVSENPIFSPLSGAVKGLRNITGLGRYRPRYRGRGLLDKEERYRVNPRDYEEQDESEYSDEEGDAYEQYEDVKKNPLSRLRNNQ